MLTDLASLLRLAEAKGSDQQFREWIKRQKSCLTDRYSEYQDGVGYSIPCHVRRSREAGTAFKPLFSCVPMHNDEHQLQSRLGEVACLERYLGGSWTVEEAKDWFDSKRVEYLTRWIAS